VKTERPEAVADTLVTVRDFVRYAVSRFEAAGLAYGQGTTTALDEACFLVLETLKLPIDDVNPFAEARLLDSERRLLAGRIDERARSRTPAAYITGRAYVGGVPFIVDERVIVPRSYIGELIARGEVNALASDMPEGAAILDLCTGSGCLAILAARAFPGSTVDAVDASSKALEVARLNVEACGEEDRIRLLEGDLFAPVARQRYDLIISNPPYVSDEAMATLPEEFRREPSLALAGGRDGLDVVRRILTEAAAHLKPEGGLLCEIGTGRHGIVTAYPDLPFLWLDTEESEGEVFWIDAGGLSMMPR
jgi:ribosomal protein L3 glutamine methyltransferase